MKKMTTAMSYPIRFWTMLLAALLIYQFSTEATADNCKFEKKIETTMDLSKSELLHILANAGDLEVVGVSASALAVIHGLACASSESWLEQSEIITTPGKQARIEVSLPNTEGGWNSFGNRYAMIHLRIEVPENLALDIKDSSGDMSLRNVAAVKIKDSSGEIEIENALGTVSIADSSGDIEVDNAAGDVTIESDSSGDIDIMDVNASVLVVSDSSGDIEVARVSKDFVVERDSSGDISADDIGGDFRVLKDGSGDIRASNVEGDVDIPVRD